MVTTANTSEWAMFSLTRHSAQGNWAMFQELWAFVSHCMGIEFHKSNEACDQFTDRSTAIHAWLIHDLTNARYSRTDDGKNIKFKPLANNTWLHCTYCTDRKEKAWKSVSELASNSSCPTSRFKGCAMPRPIWLPALLAGTCFILQLKFLLRTNWLPCLW